MERKEYLEVMRRRAMGDAGARVKYKGGKYEPMKYELWYDSKGTARHSAVLVEGKRRSVLYVRLEQVEKDGEGREGSGC